MENTLTLPKEAKIWMYQSSSQFTTLQLATIQQELTNFLQTWESHGVRLVGDFKIIANQFILLGVDERTKDATGCSIDKSVSIIKKIENLLSINLTDKGLVAYEYLGQIKTADFKAIKSTIESEEIMPETIIFNLSVNKHSDLESNWRIAAKDSWINKYFNK